VLAPLSRKHRRLRLEVRCGLSAQIASDLELGLLDLGMFRALDADAAQFDAAWADPLYWVAAAEAPPAAQAVLSLVVFPHGCALRGHVLAQLDAMRRPWRIAYTSPNVAGVLAAVQAGMGVSLLSGRMLQDAHGLQVLDHASGLPPVPRHLTVLKAARDGLGPGARDALERLRAFMAE
jgi:DNA-binding transcriptional LysR family regulator